MTDALNDYQSDGFTQSKQDIIYCLLLFILTFVIFSNRPAFYANNEQQEKFCKGEVYPV